jgi:predicted P-loop ATPase
LWDGLSADTVRLIWAEAVELFKKGEKLYLPKDVEKLAREVQEAYEEENPRIGLVAAYLDKLLPKDWEEKDTYTRRAWLEADAQDGTEERTDVCTLEIWAEALGENPNRFDRYASMEVRNIMASLPEWRHQGNKQKTIRPYGRQRYYKKETEI